jgi:hypothetical protein
VCAQIAERNAAASPAAVARAAATAAVTTPAIRALCFSYTGPRPVQILSDFEECLIKYNWLSSQPDSSPVGDPEDAWEGQQQTRGTVSNWRRKSTALGTRLVTGTTSLTPSTTRRRQSL